VSYPSCATNVQLACEMLMVPIMLYNYVIMYKLLYVESNQNCLYMVSFFSRSMQYPITIMMCKAC